MNDIERQARNWHIRVTTWDVVGIVSSIGLIVSIVLLTLWFFEMGK